MNCLIKFYLNAIILLLIYMSSGYSLHLIEKRYQLTDPKINSPQQQRSIHDNIVDRFHINANTIIRTHDSKALGAVYLNETELPSNEDCLYWCLETSPCNLAVYEQKRSGSCYLFDCGSTDDFRCKFTAHNFYTSSILQVNRHPYDLTEWQSQVKHEKELTKLRPQSTAAPQLSSTSSTHNLKAPSMIPTTTISTAYHKTSRCLHYQFECRNNSECIAIYNVCDGIPQCSDGSDESNDLECHKSRFNVPNPYPSHSISSSESLSQNPNNNKQMDMKILPQKTNAMTDPIYARIPSNKASQVMPAYNYPKSADLENTGQPNDQSLTSKKQNFGSSADMAANGYNTQYRGPWNQYYQQNDGLGSPDNRMGGQYQMEPQYMNNYGNRENHNSGSYWLPTGRQQSYDLSDQVLSPGSQPYMNIPRSQNSADDWLQSTSNSYNSNYYDHLSRSHTNKIDTNQRNGNQMTTSNTKLNSDSNVKNTKNLIPHKYEQQLKTQNKAKDETNNPQIYTKPKPSYSHMSSNKGYVNSASIVAVSYMHDSSQQSGRETNSAVIALTLGLCVTVLLVVLVGCRMKSFKKKIARRGRSLAHDADYLVNGMYL
ncbi:uncharacterized protein LOC128951990 [Oppia nitens]|uniref:uncharacterized protein LOC128951990 n=1 Tax=Oppia nitens TaxID=1686743 RepID=UPI0023DA5CAD|nr:uncharacterized protein LOC128951990 [Oppia nitens]